MHPSFWAWPASYTRAVSDGDLSHAEAMLINQAHAL